MINEVLYHVLPGGREDVVDFKNCCYLCKMFCKIHSVVLYYIALYLLYTYLLPEVGQWDRNMLHVLKSQDK
jgi:hypothetical protein